MPNLTQPEQKISSHAVEDKNGKLETVKKILAELILTTEDQFVETGSHLRNLASQSKTVSQKSIDISAELSGDRIQNIIDELRDMMERIQRYLNFCHFETESQTGKLDQVFVIFSQLNNPLNEFHKLVKRLERLAISTRIENARLGEYGRAFDNLVVEVNKLSENIKTKSQKMDEKTQFVHQAKANQFRQIQSLKLQQCVDANAVVSETHASLEILQEGRNRSMESSHQVSDQIKNISIQINETVLSLQFHDIVRQKIEHVIEAFDTYLEMPEAEDNDNKLYNLCILQMSQLEDALKKVSEAVSQIRGSLLKIGHYIETIANESCQFFVSSEKENSSNLDSCQRGISTVILSLRQSVEAGKHLQELLAAVFSVISEIGSFVNDIRLIGEEVELVALNGIINAAQLGEAGAALSVLADAIQSLSNDAQGQIVNITSLLSEIAELTSDQSEKNQFSTETDAANAIIAEMETDLLKLISSLQEINSLVVGNIQELENDARSIQSAIQKCVSGITAHKTFEKSLTQAMDILSEIAESLYSKLTDRGKDTASIDQLKALYTMQSERDIHDTVFNNNGIEQNMPIENEESVEMWADEVETKDSLDDNVDLF